MFGLDCIVCQKCTYLEWRVNFSFEIFYEEEISNIALSDTNK